MYSNICKHCNKYFEFENSKIFSNHVRWCGENPNNQKQDNTKFFINCSCTLCRKVFTVQNLSLHLQTHTEYKVPKGKCVWCDSDTFRKNAKFCSRSCSARHTNQNREYVKRLSEKKRRKKSTENNRRKTPKIGNCKVCLTPFEYFSWTKRVCCSMKCRMEIVKQNRGRGKKSYMERSFSAWLDDMGVVYEVEVHFRNEMLGKSYFVDFLFRDKNLIIELDGSQHKNTIEQDTIRDNFLASIGFTVVRVTHKEYQDKSKIEYIKELVV